MTRRIRRAGADSLIYETVPLSPYGSSAINGSDADGPATVPLGAFGPATSAVLYADAPIGTMFATS